MAFSITILHEKWKFKNLFFVSTTKLGRISLGEFSETIEIAMSYWKEKDYKRQWHDGLTRIVSGNPKSCIITSMYNPKLANFIQWWPMFRDGKNVIFHHQLLFVNKLPQPFNIEDPYIHIEERYSVNDEGMRISEWEVPITEILKFLESMETPSR